MKYQINWKKDSGIFIKYTGIITLNDFIEVNRKISVDSRYKSLSYNISDLRQVKTLLLSDDEIKMLSNFHAIPALCNPNQKLAIITNHPAIKAQVKKYRHFMKENDWEVQLFNQIEKARLWAANQVSKLNYSML